MVGFGAQGINMLFENNIVYNGDDCLTIGSPTNNIHFRNSYCNGGHGLSVGSLGKNGVPADVQNVLYVIQTLGLPLSLMSLSKYRKRCHGRTVTVRVFSDREFTYLTQQENSLYGARFKTGVSDIGTARKYDESPSTLSTFLTKSG